MSYFKVIVKQEHVYELVLNVANEEIAKEFAMREFLNGKLLQTSTWVYDLDELQPKPKL